MVGIVLEKQTLEMKRAVSRQYFQIDLLLEMHAKLRLSIQELTAPSQLAQMNARNRRMLRQAEHTPAYNNPSNTGASAAQQRLPLLRWQHPLRSGPAHQ